MREIVWQERFFADREKYRKNRKNIVPHGSSVIFSCQNFVSLTNWFIQSTTTF